MTEQTDAAPERGIGDNLPPDPGDLMVEEAAQSVAENNQQLQERAAKLLEAVARVPETIDDHDVEKRAIDFVKQMRSVRRTADDLRLHGPEKQPYVRAVAAVNGWFQTIIDDVDKAMRDVSDRITRFQRRVAEEERLRAEAKAEAAEKEAMLADSTAETPEEHAEVDERLQAADDARQVAASRPADRSISRTDLGASASLRSRWIHEIEDSTKIPLAKLRPYIDTPCLDKAIRGYIRGIVDKKEMQRGGSKELKGVRIYQEHKSVVR
jgi:chromosome segregation ATPase